MLRLPQRALHVVTSVLLHAPSLSGNTLRSVVCFQFMLPFVVAALAALALGRVSFTSAAAMVVAPAAFFVLAVLVGAPLEIFMGAG